MDTGNDLTAPVAGQVMEQGPPGVVKKTRKIDSPIMRKVKGFIAKIASPLKSLRILKNKKRPVATGDLPQPAVERPVVEPVSVDDHADSSIRIAHLRGLRPIPNDTLQLLEPNEVAALFDNDDNADDARFMDVSQNEAIINRPTIDTFLSRPGSSFYSDNSPVENNDDMSQLPNREGGGGTIIDEYIDVDGNKAPVNGDYNRGIVDAGRRAKALMLAKKVVAPKMPLEEDKKKKERAV